MIEKKVDVETADGVCDCELFHPSGTQAVPAVIMYPDIGGLRPAMSDMGRRLAGEGFAVLAVNQFYRAARMPVFDPPFTFGDEKSMARVAEVRPSITPDGIARDARAFADFLSAQSFVKGGIGATGFCMGGTMAVRAAAAVPGKIGAAVSFHGSGLATDAPDSPHLLAPKIKAKLYFGFAVDDRNMTPEQIEALKAALDAAHVSYDSAVYDGAHHGWMVKDHAKAYNEPQAERGWKAMVQFFKENL